MLYFLLIQLYVINPMYRYSLESFVTFLFKAIDKADAANDVEVRCRSLVEAIRSTIFSWVTRGLFERHKLIFTSLLAFRLFQRGALSEAYDAEQLQFLLRGPMASDAHNPLSDWLPNAAWCLVTKLSELKGFENLANNIAKDAPSRFKEWINEMQPEETKLPLDWKKLDQEPFQKLLVLRCLRPDRMTVALREFIRNAMPNGAAYVDCDAALSFNDILESAFQDSASTTPMYFILSPGADPVKYVEAMGRKMGYFTNSNVHDVAMGQGQEDVAFAKLDLAHKEGHWVLLQNIHLMPRWTVQLEKKLDSFAAEGSHPNFRCFLSSDPCDYIPLGILERSIKLTNEPPQGLKANLKRAFAFFPRDEFEEKDPRAKSILFGLCYFHSIVIERKKFGPKGWNMNYPFAIGDLRDSATVLFNYLEQQATGKVPWDDLRYIFGEIMYGGHIVDSRDRLLCGTYLDFYMQEELLDEAELFPFCESRVASYRCPPASTYEKTSEHIDLLPGDHPLAFGFHPNAEIGFRTHQCADLFSTLVQLQSRGAGGGDDNEGGLSVVQRAEQVCKSALEEIHGLSFNVTDIHHSIPDEELGPYQHVFLQECSYMNTLLEEMTRSLQELEAGFKGELTMSEAMENLVECLYLDQVPPTWRKLAFPSTRPLGAWLVNLRDRIEHLQQWVAEPASVPKVVWLSKLFNPQSFLTAIKQVTAQQQSLELNKLSISTEVTKRDASSIDAHPREGAYVAGLYLEGARWDSSNNVMEESKPKEMFFPMPVINCRAHLPTEREADSRNLYACPVYKTPERGATFVFNAQLKTRDAPARWILAGVAMVLDVGVSL
eukprot:GHVU01048072.1.p1 GENE.GHVU01048072.1~~GHVU01048072.1.p1  ORF type:complete len:830 (+),score=159.71 GHVU01048072.1:655-3144(+)